MPYDDPAQLRPPNYIVFDSNPLIAEDICGALQAGGSCEVIKVVSEQDLDGAIASGRPVAAIFLEMRFADVMASRLYPAMLLTGAKVVLTVGEDDAAAVLAQGWAMLLRPFTEAMVIDSLRSPVREI